MSQDSSADSYLSLAREVEIEIVVRKSRFKTFARRVLSENEAEEYLDKLRSTYRDATHHCYGYIISGDPGEITRFNDDGEPSGTAGRPILATLQGADLSNAICVVVRYFGGTKLGVGGLTHAYSDAATQAVGSAKIIRYYLTETFRLGFSYDLTGAVERLVTSFEAEVIERKFEEHNVLVCKVRKNLAQGFTEKFRDITRGKGVVSSG